MKQRIDNQRKEWNVKAQVSSVYTHFGNPQLNSSTKDQDTAPEPVPYPNLESTVVSAPTAYLRTASTSI